MKAEELRGMTAEEISAKLDEMQETLVNMEVQHESQQLSNPMQLRTARRDIARLQTIKNEQARAQAKAEPKGDTK